MALVLPTITPEGTTATNSSCASLVPSTETVWKSKQALRRLPKAPCFIARKDRFELPNLSFTSENADDDAKHADHAKLTFVTNVNNYSAAAAFARPLKTYEFDDDYPSIAASESTKNYDTPLIRREREKAKERERDMHSPWRLHHNDDDDDGDDDDDDDDKGDEVQVAPRRIKEMKRGERRDGKLKYRRAVSVDVNRNHHRLSRSYHLDRRLHPPMPLACDHPTAQSSCLHRGLRSDLQKHATETDLQHVRNSPLSLTMTSDRPSFTSSIKRRMSLGRSDDKLRGFGRRKRGQNSIMEDWNKSKMRPVERRTSDEVEKGCGFGRWFSSPRESERMKQRLNHRMKERAKDRKLVSKNDLDCGTNVLDDNMGKDVHVLSMLAYDDFMHSPQRPSAAARMFSKLRR